MAMVASMDRWVARVARFYFETSYRLLTGSSDGLRFLQLTAPLPGMTAHGYTTVDDLGALIRSLEPRVSDHLMDLGCGVGGIALEVNRRTGARVTGIDIAARAIRIATDGAIAVGARPGVSFVQGSIRHPPRVGATGAYALDSLMFLPVDVDALLGIRDALDGRGRLFSTVLGVGRAPRDRVAAVATVLGMTVIGSEDVTAGLLARSKWRRRVARHLFHHGQCSARGRLAMTLVVTEESLVQRQVRAGRLRRWQTVVDLHSQG